MKIKNLCFFAIGVLMVGVFAAGTVSAVSPPKKGNPFPEIGFPVPKDVDHRNYLGLPENGSFTLGHMKTKVVIIEVFNMY